MGGGGMNESASRRGAAPLLEERQLVKLCA
jgi:hypothetical protein